VTAPLAAPPLLWIGHTTRYREGSDKFARAAATLCAELEDRYPGRRVVLEPLAGKADFVRAMARIAAEKGRIGELHCLGHSGLYGIMFGSTSWPEQLSPHEWRSLRIPFAPGATAHFHACRTARWFAPFFARTFGVRTYGHHGYTTVSLRPDRFEFEGFGASNRPLYLVSVPGRKTHGLAGSLRKYLTKPAVEPMTACDPEPRPVSAYDGVAPLYDRAFSDIRVRRAEWRWLSAHVDRAFPSGAPRPRVLDIGCGNGALLFALRDRIARGTGVDLSAAMIERARLRTRGHSQLTFCKLDGPELPFADRSFDLVTSFLSFRYLDWDPIVAEIRRVLAPSGRLCVVDMVEQPLRAGDLPQLVSAAAQHVARHIRDRRFVRELAELTAEPAWQELRSYNPIRAAHEYRHYFESRFPGRRLETLSVGRRARIVAFDTGPLDGARFAPLTYP
jgi:ubiquinone/menaquinone biosynthesis C-methylase UbiE